MKIRKGFTLIELLVVIAIIAIMAALLMPALGRAREAAKASACLSNLHNIGIALQMYLPDNKGHFPTCYEYLNGDSSAGGYHHWTSMITAEDYTDPVNWASLTPMPNGYPRSADQYVCPSHPPGGFAPTNFTFTRIAAPPAGQVTQTAGIDDQQAPRLSYVANEAIMPRKKYSAAHDANPLSPATTKNLCTVSPDEIDDPQNTILVGEFSASPNCIFGSSIGGGAAYKSHRPTNAAVVGPYTPGNAACVFDGELYDASIKGQPLYKLTIAEANAAINAVLTDTTNTVAAVTSHISYINPSAHRTGSNYLFVDGHGAKYTLADTLDPGNWMWGRKMYSCVDKPTLGINPNP